MKGILRRPLAVCCGIFLLLLFFALRSDTPHTLPLGAGALLVALGTLFTSALTPATRPLLKRGLFWCAGIFLACSLAFFSAWRANPTRLTHSIAPYEGQAAEAHLTVTQVQHTSAYSTTLLCNLDSLEGQTTDLTGRLTLPYQASLRIGDRIALPITIHLLSAEGPLADSYALSQGISFEAEGAEDNYRLLSHTDLFPQSQLARFRLFLRRGFYPYLNNEEIGIATALLTGDRSGLSAELQEQFRNLGISHTLAVSGLHLGILFGSLAWCFRKLRLPRYLHFPILLPLLLIYTAMVGSLSVLRAGGMLLFLFAAYPLGRLRDSLTSLFATVGAICLLSPHSILDIGLLLSFFATWGILLIMGVLTPKLAPLPRPIRLPLTALGVTGAATLFTLPFSVWYFGEWAILTPLSNLILVPLITALLYLAPILLFLSPIPPLATAPALLIRGLTALLSYLTELLGQSDHLMLPLSYFAIHLLALILMTAVIPLCLFRRTRPLTLAIALLFLSFSGGYCFYHSYRLLGENTILPYTDGINECLLVRAGTRTLLIDCAVGDYEFLSDAIQTAEEDPMIRVDALLLTHYNHSQISALTALLANGHIEYLVLPEPFGEENNIAQTLASRALSVECKVRRFSLDQSCVGYHDYEIALDYITDGMLRSISICTEQVQLIYSATSQEDLQISATSSNDLLSQRFNPPQWNQPIPIPSV